MVSRPHPGAGASQSAPLIRQTTHPPGALGLLLLFLSIVTVPGLGLALGIDRSAVSESEMRELARWPAWSWTLKDMAAWPGAFQEYFEDHFMLRNRLIDWRSSLLWNGLGTSATDQVITGKHGWLFYAADGGIEDWTQAAPFTRDELEVWRETLVRRRAFLARRGIRFLFVVAPDKQMIYPEYMPDTLRRLRDDFRADQLIAHMRETTPDFAILDLRPAIRDAKSSELLYHRYDTHWNDRGALVGWQAMAHALRQWFPGIQALGRDDFDTNPAVPSGDNTTMLGLTDPGKVAMPGLVLRRGDGYRVVFPEQRDPHDEVVQLVTAHQDPTLPRLVMFRDSFGTRLIPFISEHFSRASYLWQNEFDFEYIEQEQPDVVIQEYVARHFFVYVPYPGIIPR